MYTLGDSVPYLLNRVGVRIGELFGEELAKYGLTVPMYRVLAALLEHPGARLGELSALVSVELTTLSRLIGTMQRRGLVSRTRPQDNARIVQLALTNKGRALANKLIPLAVEIEKHGIHGIPPVQISALKRNLNAIYANLNGTPAKIGSSTIVANRSRQGDKRRAHRFINDGAGDKVGS